MDEAAGFVSPNWREELQHRTLDEWWEPVRYQHRIGEIDVPVLHISGWYDDEEIGTPANFAAMTAAGRAGQRLLMGPWGHAVNTTRTLGEIDFGPDALIDLDAHVHGVPGRARPGHPPGPGRPRRCGSSSWAPASGATRRPGRRRARRPRSSTSPAAGDANSRFGDGRLVPAAVTAGEPPDEWTHDPDRPVPFITSASSAQIGGPDDYLGVESRGDVLVFTSDPLTGPMEVIGPVRVVAHVATSAADTDITAKLVDVHPGGFAQRLCDGMVRLRYRDGFGRGQPVDSRRGVRGGDRACGTRACGCPPGTVSGWRSRPRRSPSSTSTSAPAGT